MATIKKFFGYVWPALTMFILCHLFLIADRWWTRKVYVWARDLPSWDDFFYDSAITWGWDTSGFLFSLVSLVLLVLIVIAFAIAFVALVSVLILLAGYGMKLVDAMCKTREHRVAPLLLLAFYGYTCLSLPLRYGHISGTRRVLFEMGVGACVVFVFATAITFMLLLAKEREE